MRADVVPHSADRDVLEPSSRPAAPWLDRIAAALLIVALAATAACVGLCWRSYHQMPPASGAVAALADAVLRGQAPGAEDGQSFLGTYYFPPAPAAVAALRRAGMGPREAQRTTAIVFGALLLAAVAWLARILGARWGGVALALALLISTFPFKIALLGGRSDFLAAAFSIGAMAGWMRDPQLRGWAAPSFAAAAILTRAISVVVPAAAVLWLLFHRDGRGVLRFGLRLALALALGVLLMLPVHGPAWYLQVVRDLLAAPPGTWSLLRGPAEALRYAAAFAEIAVLLAVGLALLAHPALRKTPAPLIAAVLVAHTLWAMCDFGAGDNHLLELLALSAALAAAWIARAALGALPMILLAAALVIPGAAIRELGPVLRYGARNTRTQITALVRNEPGAVLTEDAMVSLAAGRRPVLSDAGAFRSLAESGDERAMRVVREVRAGRFELVVLIEDLSGAQRWYRTMHLGDAMVDALHARYHKVGVVDGFHLYRVNR